MGIFAGAISPFWYNFMVVLESDVFIITWLDNMEFFAEAISPAYINEILY